MQGLILILMITFRLAMIVAFNLLAIALFIKLLPLIVKILFW